MTSGTLRAEAPALRWPLASYLGTAHPLRLGLVGILIDQSLLLALVMPSQGILLVSAGNGPLVTLTVDGAGAGYQAPPPPGDTASDTAGATGDTGAAAPSYAVTAADAGARISVQVTAEREHYAPTTVASDATAAVTARFGPVARPRLVGTARVRGVVRVRLGGVVPRPDRISVAWRRGTTRLAARGATYRVTARDRGRRITAVVTYRRVGFDPLSVATTATRPVR